MARRLSIVLCFFLPALALKAQIPETTQIRNIQIPRITRPPILEEFLGGNSRPDMRRVDDFRQRQPGDGVQVSRKTVAWIGYDDKNLYAVFACESPAGETRARLNKREDILSDDVVAIFLDTYQDHQRAYEFFVNPLGVQGDAVETDGQNDDFSFDTLWFSDGRITPEGFTAMIGIPFKSLRFSPQSMQTWGFALGRFIPTNNESSFWPYVTQKVNGFSAQMGTVDGLENISPGRNFQIIPYAAAGHAHFLNEPAIGAPSFRTSEDHRAGVEAKAVIHDSLTLDIAVNPDFSQVESDDPQVTINQRYEVQFPEKRAFFVENNGFFLTPETLFFSRRVINPEFGGRLTGKLGRWNLGALAIDDRAAGIALGQDDPDYGKHALIGVVRIQREFGRQSSAGFLLTDREFAGGYNRVGAFDTRLKLNPVWELIGQAITSQTQDKTGAHSGGDAWHAELRGQNRHYFYDLLYQDFSEGFHTDLGFVPRVNTRHIEQFVNQRFHPKNKVILSYGPRLFVRGDLDRHGVQTDWAARPGFQMEMARTTFLQVSRAEIFERFNNINFRRKDTGFGGHSEYFKSATLDFSYSQGTRINYNTPAGLNAFLGQGRDFQTTITFRPTRRLKLDEIYFFSSLKTDSGTPHSVFVNHLVRSRLNYQFTRELSLRMIVDYNGVLQNPALVSLDRQKRLTGDVLLTYLIHPGTAFYLGYTDSLENLSLVPGFPSTLARLNFPSTTTQRQFFAKVSYLIRF